MCRKETMLKEPWWGEGGGGEITEHKSSKLPNLALKTYTSSLSRKTFSRIREIKELLFEIHWKIKDGFD